ncbi:MAG: hypothetical protein GWO20_06480, partial [Candidatus Korarchaeota archaeon]|nr:hypothetical protein [Candidatus Korarchaeota archaeon]NIU83091.1 hypothetical protein [Candidatus Thorarchaeota archaeon]NIW13469.1 hypothetical protein [Candidatus Thorarchaeota archaeon]
MSSIRTTRFEDTKRVERIKTFTTSAIIISLLLLGIVGFNSLAPVHARKQPIMTNNVRVSLHEHTLGGSLSSTSGYSHDVTASSTGGGQTTPWGVNQINALQAQAEVDDESEAQIDVAVLDSGVAYDHPDLEDNSHYSNGDPWGYSVLDDSILPWYW